ncbi:acyltransferase family protein [Micromonospora sp. DT228]|uniref:acyltransferase family protein n=1 Tax=Micromonospora sp. DT228 TaxID=3393443 RepID=UPI003CE68D05
MNSHKERMPRVESLTGLRWFAAFAVFLFHANQIIKLPTVYGIKLGDFFRFGDAGVTFFYVLSGFVLTWSFSPTVGTGTFYWRRFARVWPALVVSTAIAWVSFDQVWHDSWKRTLLSLSLTESWFPPAAHLVANPVAWSVSCEAFFYLLFPFVIRPLLRLRLPALAIIAAAGLFVEWAYWFFVQDLIDPKEYWIQLSWFLRFPPIRFIEFLLGMIAAAALLRGWRPKLNLWVALSTVPASVLLLWWGAQLGWWGAHWSQQGLVPACVLVVLAAAIRDISGRPSIFRSKPLVALGAWSYAFYLVHLSVIYWLMGTVKAGPASWTNVKVLLIWTVLGIALAWACYRWVEHPVERYLRNLYPRRVPPAPPAPSAPPAPPSAPAEQEPQALVVAAEQPTEVVLTGRGVVGQEFEPGVYRSTGSFDAR